MEKTVKRWSAARKMEVVLRIMRGESLEAISREIGVAASRIEEWQRDALMGIESSLKIRVDDPVVAELDLAKKQIGELSMENELLRERSRKRGVFLGGKLRK